VGDVHEVVDEDLVVQVFPGVELGDDLPGRRGAVVPARFLQLQELDHVLPHALQAVARVGGEHGAEPQEIGVLGLVDVVGDEDVVPLPEVERVTVLVADLERHALPGGRCLDDRVLSCADGLGISPPSVVVHLVPPQ
jgi:hypothetical protein